MQRISPFFWPSFKFTLRPIQRRALPRQRRDLRPEKGFGRYWQRLMRKHRQHALLRKTAPGRTMPTGRQVAMRPYTTRRISVGFGNQTRWYAISV